MTKSVSYGVQDARETLLTIAEEVFAQYSFAGASIRLITERSGMNSAMISYYFGSKEALYHHIFEVRLKEVAEEISRFEALDLDPAEKLRSYLRAYIQRIASNKSFHQLVRNELVTVQHPSVIILLSETRERIYNFLLHIIQRGIAEGYFKKIHEELFALNILALIPALFTEHLPARVHLSHPSNENFAGEIVSYIMSALTIEDHHYQFERKSHV
ncbi:MAG: TetR/AcrR family transcriptional regulator [Mucilaginibacter sp.]|uniref:TetR/AcrR family transcriptional regulator n=1 Tax=Mucilaginibacter sp. TaxID=1882438 RepID=UPI0031B08B50